MERNNCTQLGLPGKHEIQPDRSVCGIPCQDVVEISLRTKEVAGKSCVNCVPEAAMGVGRVVTVILYVTARQQSDPDWLQQGRNQQRRNLYVTCAHPSVGEPHEKSRRTVKPLRNLD